MRAEGSRGQSRSSLSLNDLFHPLSNVLDDRSCNMPRLIVLKSTVLVVLESYEEMTDIVIQSEDRPLPCF